MGIYLERIADSLEELVVLTKENKKLAVQGKPGDVLMDGSGPGVMHFELPYDGGRVIYIRNNDEGTHFSLLYQKQNDGDITKLFEGLEGEYYGRQEYG